MQRLAFKMKLNLGQKEVYKKRHRALWPELKKMLKDNGVSEYSIFFEKKCFICHDKSGLKFFNQNSTG